MTEAVKKGIQILRVGQKGKGMSFHTHSILEKNPEVVVLKDEKQEYNNNKLKMADEDKTQEDNEKEKIDLHIEGVVDHSKHIILEAFGAGDLKIPERDLVLEEIKELHNQDKHMPGSQVITFLCSKYTGTKLLYAVFHFGELVGASNNIQRQKPVSELLMEGIMRSMLLSSLASRTQPSKPKRKYTKRKTPKKTAKKKAEKIQKIPMKELIQKAKAESKKKRKRKA
jgi:hypothetical protein